MSRRDFLKHLGFHQTKSPLAMSNKWEYKEYFSKGYMEDDYSGHYEVTNGNISLCTTDDPEDITDTENTLHRIANALNDSGCKFYVNTTAELNLHNENMLLRMALEEIAQQRLSGEPEQEGHVQHNYDATIKIAREALKRKINDERGTNKG